MGPLWGLGLTLDGNLTLVVLAANLAFALAFSLTTLRRRRPPIDQVLVVLGLFFVLTTLSLIGLYYFAGTPVRDLQLFVVD